MRALRSPHVLRGLLPFGLIAALLATGCSDGTAPGGSVATGDLPLDGGYDAAEGVFHFAVVDSVPGHAIAIELIGSDLAVDPESEELSISVAIRNNGEALHPPLMIWLSDFHPVIVTVLNPDAVDVDAGLTDVLPPLYGFDYSELLGEDGLLSPGETSGAKRWRFHDPGLVSFAFGVRVSAGQVPGLARIAGRVWQDLNGDGIREHGEPPWPGVPVLVETPDGQQLTAYADAEGRYGFPALAAGLYRLTCDFSNYDMPPPFFTTPNPLSVLMVPDPNGELQSYLDADFGLWWGPQDPPPVVFTDLPPDSLHFAPWHLIRAGIEGDRLDLQVGFSGCQPRHPWTFFISGGFMESYPVQVTGVLVHELDEDCDAAFETTLRFDLKPLKRAYIQAYGGNQTLILDLVDYAGEAHPLEYWIGDLKPPD